jgi:enoyl-CoA hydratase
MDVVLTERHDRVLTVTLNRPEARNALNRMLLGALWDAVTTAGDDPDTDVVILTGADPAFSAGVDLKELASGGEPPGLETTGGDTAGRDTAGRDTASPAEPVPAAGSPRTGPFRDTNGLYRMLPVIDKPVIAAINGTAVTGGFELAMQCDFLIASAKARFADTHGRVGVMPGGGMTVQLSRALGWRRAVELSLTGNFITAAQAYELGLVNHVVMHEELLPTARRIAADIVSNDQVAVRALLRHYRRIANSATPEEAQLAEGLLSETWTPGFSQAGERRAAVMERGRQQAHG